MKLTRKEALDLHRQMWEDMQEKLGDNPTPSERVLFKEEWCEEHFPNDMIENDCFLCEYTEYNIFDNGPTCSKCPIIWPGDTCYKNQYYYTVPISVILALPEREVAE